MILADKIIENRKKNGWSQEELAEMLGVSRQSVSKWEGAQAVPDMKKIVQMSELFGVTTDYLLKDEIEDLPDIELAEDSGRSFGYDDIPVRKVTMEEASEFLNYNRSIAGIVSIAVMLCILSPVLLIALAALSEAGKIGMSEDTSAFAGLAVLFCFVGVAVAIFVKVGISGQRFKYFEEEMIETAYGVSGMVSERRKAYQERHTRDMVIGVTLCVVSVIPLFIAGMLSSENDLYVTLAVSVLLTVVALGVKIIVNTSVIWGSMDKLLEEGDYTRMNKKLSKYDGIYWMIMTAIYLAASFLTMRWDRTWIIWPVAGVLFAAYRELIKSRIGRY